MNQLELAFIGNLGGGELLLLGVIALLFVGGKKLPEFGRGLGRMMREFKQASDGVFDDQKENIAVSAKIEDMPKELPASQENEKSASAT